MDESKLVALDIECYQNYLLIMFKKLASGKVIYFDMHNDSKLNTKPILKILNDYTITTFNGIGYDKLILDAALSNFSNRNIYRVSCAIIKERRMSWDIMKDHGITEHKFNHIDVMNIAPLKASLKIYSGRIHCCKMQDLPIEPDEIIKVDHQIVDLIEYCENDLDNTISLYDELLPSISLRILMSKKYGIDMRSMSDAQIAEAIFKHELEKTYGMTLNKVKLQDDITYQYKAPNNLKFKSLKLKDLLAMFQSIKFKLDYSGHIIAPDELKNLHLKIGATSYSLGVGGLHSREKKRSCFSDNDYILRDYDVAAYYPNIIINNKLAPAHLGEPFRQIYAGIVRERLAAKKRKDVPADKCLKIVINGTFGKLGSKWSKIYAPELMLMTTLTGQLTLLMLIERLELKGVNVISGNTDGIIVKMRPNQIDLVESMIADWELDTDYYMDSTDYISIHNRSVNDYFALTKNGIKAKGATYGEPALSKNPSNIICAEAVKQYVIDGTPIFETVKTCKDIRKFVTIRTVKGGAVKDGVLIGKAIRWYYGSNELDAIFYRKNDNIVPRTAGAVPIMQLPDTLPDDLDYDWYIKECNKMLTDIGYHN